VALVRDVHRLSTLREQTAAAREKPMNPACDTWSEARYCPSTCRLPTPADQAGRCVQPCLFRNSGLPPSLCLDFGMRLAVGNKVRNPNPGIQV
jgi:hypothetical protein